MEGPCVNGTVGNAVGDDDGGAESCLVEVTDGRVVGSAVVRIVGEKLGSGDFERRIGLVVRTIVGARDEIVEGFPVGDREGAEYGSEEGLIVNGDCVRAIVDMEGAMGDGFLVGPREGCEGLSDDGAIIVSDDG